MSRVTNPTRQVLIVEKREHIGGNCYDYYEEERSHVTNVTNTTRQVLIVEKREHIGGNCYDYYEEESGLLVNKYGAHLFHTNKQHVWYATCCSVLQSVAVCCSVLQ